MKKAAAHPTTKSLGNGAGLSAGDIALQFLDTTWRIAVPVVLFVAAGIVGDRWFETKPWLTLLGLVVGFVVAGWLVKRELDAALKEEN